jgi:hypothetical protein
MSDFLTSLAGADHPVGRALTRRLNGAGPDVRVDNDRSVMLSVSADHLESFRHESSFGVFADILGPLDNEMREQLVFFMARDNVPGVFVDRLAVPPAWILSIGQPYSFGDLVGAIAYVLQSQGIKRGADCFASNLRDHGLDPGDPSFSSILDQP